MTTATPAKRSWLRPGVILPTTVALILVIVLITPPEDEGGSDPRLTTYSASPLGARGVYDILSQLGWHTSRRTTVLRAPLDTGAVYVILAPSRPLSDSEDSVLVHTVRAGGRVLLVSLDSTFTAPFHMQAVFEWHSIRFIDQTSAAGDSAGLSHREPPRATGIGLVQPPQGLQFVIHLLPPLNDTLAIFLWGSPAREDSATAAVFAMGRRIGRGRVVLISDPSLLRNDVLREGRAALAVERAIEWLDPPNRRVIFDEYHQGYDTEHLDPVSVISRALTDTAAGRAGLQVIVAALIFLFAIGARPLRPAATPVIQRRSSLEHVGALARAYEQIHATQLGMRYLLRGIRRRHPMGSTSTGYRADDIVYLDAIRTRYSMTTQDMAAIKQALATQADDDIFLEAGRTIGRLEHSITTQ